MEDLPIGAEVVLKVVEAENCDGCFFDGDGGCVAISLGMECVPKYRSDNKDVIFKEVKE